MNFAAIQEQEESRTIEEFRQTKLGQLIQKMRSGNETLVFITPKLKNIPDQKIRTQ